MLLDDASVVLGFQSNSTECLYFYGKFVNIHVAGNNIYFEKQQNVIWACWESFPNVTSLHKVKRGRNSVFQSQISLLVANKLSSYPE